MMYSDLFMVTFVHNHKSYKITMVRSISNTYTNYTTYKLYMCYVNVLCNIIVASQFCFKLAI